MTTVRRQLARNSMEASTIDRSAVDNGSTVSHIPVPVLIEEWLNSEPRVGPLRKHRIMWVLHTIDTQLDIEVLSS